MWFYGAEYSRQRGYEMGSCLAFLRSITVTGVAGTEGLIKERHGGTRLEEE